MKVMLDTNTCIYAMKQVEGFEPKRPLRDCGISIVVLGELEWGVWRSARVDRNLAALNDLLAAIQVADLDAEVARRYGRLRAHLFSVGKPIGPNDLGVAAHALARELPLVSHNISEFQRVPGLSVETWLTGPAARQR